MVANKKEIKFLEKKIAKNPDSPLFARLADLHLEQGDVDKAIEICEEGLQEHPYYVTGHIVLGKCYAALGMNDQAKTELKRVLLFDPQCISATKVMGDMMKDEGWENLYRESYRRLSMLDPLEESIMQIVEEFGPESKSLQEKEPLSHVVETAEEKPLEQSGYPDAEVSKVVSDEVVEEIIEPIVKEETPSDSAQSVAIGIESQTETALPIETITPEQPLEASLESGKEELFAVSPFEGKSFEEEPITFAQPEPAQITLETSVPSTEQLSEPEPFSREGVTVESEVEMVETGLPPGNEDFKKSDEVEEVLPKSMINIQSEGEVVGVTAVSPEGSEEKASSVIEDKRILEKEKGESGVTTESWGAWETLEKGPADIVEPQEDRPGTGENIIETVPASGTTPAEMTEESGLPFEEGLKEEKFIELSESPEDMQDQISLEKTKELDWILNESEEEPKIVEEDADTSELPKIEKESEERIGLETMPVVDLGKEEAVVTDFKEISALEEEKAVLPTIEKESDEIEEILPEVEPMELSSLEEQNQSMEDSLTGNKETAEKEFPVLEEKDESESEEFLLAKDIPRSELPDENLSVSDEALLTVSDREFFDTMEKGPELPEPLKGELLSLIDEVIGGRDETESVLSSEEVKEPEDLSNIEVIDLKLDTQLGEDEISDVENQEDVRSIGDIPGEKKRTLRDQKDLKTGIERDSRTPEEFSLKEYEESLQREDDLKTGIDRALNTSDLHLRDLDEILRESDGKKLRDKSVQTGMREFESREVTDSEKEIEREYREKTEEEFTLLPELPEKGGSRDEELDLESQESGELLIGKQDFSLRTPEELKTGRIPEREEESEIEGEESYELSLREPEEKMGSGLNELVTLTLGEIYLSKNQLDKAIKVFKQLKEIYPDNKKISTKLRRAQRLKRNAQKGQKNTDESTDPETSQEWRITGD